MDRETELFIINVLRQGTVKWPGRTECLNRGRRKRAIGKKKNGEEKFLWERVCDGCGVWHLQKNNTLEVDHLDPVNGFTGDFDVFVRRLYCEQTNLQALCRQCHLRKTNIGNASARFERKNKAEDLL